MKCLKFNEKLHKNLLNKKLWSSNFIWIFFLTLQHNFLEVTTPKVSVLIVLSPYGSKSIYQRATSKLHLLICYSHLNYKKKNRVKSRGVIEGGVKYVSFVWAVAGESKRASSPAAFRPTYRISEICPQWRRLDSDTVSQLSFIGELAHQPPCGRLPCTKALIDRILIKVRKDVFVYTSCALGIRIKNSETALSLRKNAFFA